MLSKSNFRSDCNGSAYWGVPKISGGEDPYVAFSSGMDLLFQLQRILRKFIDNSEQLTTYSYTDASGALRNDIKPHEYEISGKWDAGTTRCFAAFLIHQARQFSLNVDAGVAALKKCENTRNVSEAVVRLALVFAYYDNG